MSLRDGEPYKRLLRDFDKALRQVGLDDTLDVDALVGRINVDGLEPLMLASYRIMRFMRNYIAVIQCEYTEATKVPDFFVALHYAVLATTSGHRMKLVTDEARIMEHLSRATYRKLKTYNMLKYPKHINTLLRD